MRASLQARPPTSPRLSAMDRLEQLRWRLLGYVPSDRLLGWLGPLTMAVVGGILRFWSLDRPHQLVFDETYYVKQGASMLLFGTEMQWDGEGEEVDPLFTSGTIDVFQESQGDMVVHPPVGKWIIAAGEWVFGADSSWGWRVAVALLGTISILMVGRIARRLFRSSVLGTVASFLMVFEGHHFVHSRTGLLDLILMFFALAAFGALLIDRDWSRERLATKVARLDVRHFATGPWLLWRPWRLVAALSLGLATGTKWSGLYFFAAFGLMTVLWDVGARRAVGARNFVVAGIFKDGPWAFVTMSVIVLATYLGSFAGWFLGDRGYNRDWAAQHPGEGIQWLPPALRSLWEYHTEILSFHDNLTSPHSYESNPWSWMIQSRPTSFFYETKTEAAAGCDVEKCSKAISSVGTVSIWWVATIALVVLLFWWIFKRDWRAGAILAGFAGGWLPWFFLQHRTIFTFYTISFEPWVILAVVFLLGLALGAPGASTRRRQIGYLVVGAYCLVVLANFAFFWPIWTAQVIPYDHWRWRMWFPSWV